MNQPRTPRSPRLRWTLARRKIVWAYIFLAIPIVFFAYIRIYPTIFAFQMSLHDYNPLAQDQPYVGMENYEKVFEELNKRKSVTKSAFRNTASYLLLGVPIQLCLALAIALMLNEIRFMSTLYRILFFLPFVTSTIAIAWVFRMLYQPRFGLFNIVLQLIGLPQQPFLKTPQQALPSILALVIWQGMGFAVIIFLAGLKQISRTYMKPPKSMAPAAGILSATSPCPCSIPASFTCWCCRRYPSCACSRPCWP